MAVIAAAVVLTACGGGGSGLTSVTDPVSSGDAGTTPVTPGGAVGTASLAWSAPVNRTDGQPLSLGEIKEYRIYYGTGSGNYVYQVKVSDATATSYTIADLPLGTYFFVLTTVDKNGQESGYSGEAVRSVTS